jgi:hypothetical protein
MRKEPGLARLRVETVLGRTRLGEMRPCVYGRRTCVSAPLSRRLAQAHRGEFTEEEEMDSRFEEIARIGHMEQDRPSPGVLAG